MMESIKSPGPHSRKLSTCPTEPQKEHDDTNSKYNNMVASRAWEHHNLSSTPQKSIASWQGHTLSPTPQEPIHDTKTTKIDPTPTSYPSHDTLTLAHLYQSSRRSRHISPQDHRSGQYLVDIISPKMIPPPPLISSSFLESERIGYGNEIMNADNNTARDKAWSFNIATPICNSCSSNSVSSMGSEGLIMTHEAPHLPPML